MAQNNFKHHDPDNFHDKELTLHDCVAEKITYTNGILRFHMSKGLWITPHHKDNNLNKTVRTDFAVVDFSIDNIDDIIVRVFTQNIFRKMRAELWEMKNLMNDINKGKYTITFISQYRAPSEQLWYCSLHSERKPHYRECHLHLPKTSAVFHWNNLRPDCEW